MELVALLRFIPYAIAMWIAWQKGYPRLLLMMCVLILISVINLNFSPSQEFRGIEGSIFSFFLLLHVLDLKTRKQPKVRG